MVNTRTDAELAAAVQAAVDAMLPQLREQVREEYRTGAVTSGSNPPPVTIHTWLERFNKQKPRSFEKAVAPVDAENWISLWRKIFDVIGLPKEEMRGPTLTWQLSRAVLSSVLPSSRTERLKREYHFHPFRPRRVKISTELHAAFLRLASFLDRPAVTEQKSRRRTFRWGFQKSIPTIGHDVYSLQTVAQEFWCWDATKGQGSPVQGWSSVSGTARRTHLVLRSSGHADRKPDASAESFALPQDQAANTSPGTITVAYLNSDCAVFIREDLSYTEEPESILDRQDRVMRNKTIPFVKILWRNHPEREATWETEESIRTSYPHISS
ncbi:zinc finger, CCHC-type, retrotransposon gag domain protein [Tanacetum coccineum]